jgi:P4 family phage/plasmid primase-like protien
MKIPNTDSPFLTAALKIISKGKPVFPCGEGKKTPLTPHGFQDATTDEASVRQWAAKWPNANLAIPTGERSGLIVLDVDQDEGKDGEAALSELISKNGPLPVTLEVRTPRGGRHLYFQYPGQKVPSRTNHPAPALDVRGDGGYVLIPPSATERGVYTWANRTAPAECPPWLLDLLLNGTAPAEKPQAITASPAPARSADPTEEEARIRDALRFIPAGDYDTWCKIGMAIHSEMPDGHGLALWEAWSRSAPEKYNEGQTARKWAGFKTDRPGGVTLGTLFVYAKRGGWTPTQTSHMALAGAGTTAAPDDSASVYGPPLIVDGKSPKVNQAYFSARYVHDSGIVHDPAVARFYIYDPVTGLWQHQTDEKTAIELGSSFQRVLTEVDCASLLARRTASLLHGLRDLTRGIAERRDVFNQRRDVIHVGNGMLALNADGHAELKPFGPEWYSRNRSEIAWNPEADCPRFKQELLLSAMDEADASLIQRYAGQCLLGINVSQTFLILRGTPGGGKSTLANVLEGLIGRHNVTELRVPHLGERFELIRFVGRTLLSGKDVPGDFLNMRPAHVLKALVGGDTLEGEVKNGNESFGIEGRLNVLISTNTRLRVKLDSDAGAWQRRMLIVDYARPKPVKPIPGFDALLLHEEGPGILRWAVDGAISLTREMAVTGCIHLTDTQRRRVDDLLSESDSVRSFVRDRIETAHGGELAIHDLTAAYRDYCEIRDWEPLRDRQFQAELPDAMLEYHRAIKRNDIHLDGKSVRGFRGVKLQTSSERPSEASEPYPERQLSDASDASPNTIAHVSGGKNDCKNALKSPTRASEASEVAPERCADE